MTDESSALTDTGQSGFPTLAPSSHAMCQAIISIIHQLQNTDEWKQAIASALGQRYSTCT